MGKQKYSFSEWMLYRILGNLEAMMAGGDYDQPSIDDTYEELMGEYRGDVD